jgi:hypothetical protein
VGLQELAQLPSTPPRDTVVKLLDREPLKKLLRAQVVDTLTAFGRKAASPMADNAVARGLGGLGKLALGAATKGGSPLGALANAVSGEVERQVEKRASDFADTAVAGILDGLADQMSDPARAKEQAAMRLAVLDGLLGLTGVEAAQLARGPVEQRVAAVRKALAAWAAEDSFEADVASVVRTVVAEDWTKTVAEVLDGFGVKDVVKAEAVALAKEKIAAVVAGDAFAQWLAGVVAG